MIVESEVSTGNASGKAGVASMPFGRGFYNYGGNNGAAGITFTPSSEPSYKTYKSMKHSKKKLNKMKKKMKMKMEKYKDFITEEACATAGNTGGMGAVSAATPSSTPGDVAGSTPGSGDIGQTLGTYTKPALNLKKKKKKMKNLESFNNFNPKNESVEIDNFTSRFYDNYDDEEPAANEDDLQNFSSTNKKIQMFEDFLDKVTYEMSGSPSPYFKTKADFVAAMQDCGYYHTTLNKKTDMLICSTDDLGTLKFQKAQKYGIPIYTYSQAKKEMKNLVNTASKYNL